MLKSKRKRLPRREMPFFSSRQNNGVLFAYSGHKLIYTMYKSRCICNKILHKKFLQKGQYFCHFDSTQKSYEKRLKWPLFKTFIVLGIFVFLFILHKSL